MRPSTGDGKRKSPKKKWPAWRPVIEGFWVVAAQAKPKIRQRPQRRQASPGMRPQASQNKKTSHSILSYNIWSGSTMDKPTTPITRCDQAQVGKHSTIYHIWIRFAVPNDICAWDYTLSSGTAVRLTKRSYPARGGSNTDSQSSTKRMPLGLHSHIGAEYIWIKFGSLFDSILLWLLPHRAPWARERSWPKPHVCHAGEAGSQKNTSVRFVFSC